MMNCPLSISSLWTVSGSTPNFSVIIFRAVTGETVPPQFTPIMMTLSRLICWRLASSYIAIMSQPLTVIAIFISLAPSRYFLTSLDMSSVPQWRDPAVLSTSFGSVMNTGTAS